MKQRKTDFWRKCQFPLMMMLGTIPVTLYVLGAMVPEWMNFGWVVGGMYVVLALITLLVPGKRRVLCGLLGCVVLLALGGWAMLAGGHWSLVVPSVVYCILLLWGMQMGGWNWDEELPTMWYWVGIAVHVVAQVVYSASSTSVERNYLNVTTVTISKLNSLFAAARPGTLVAFFGFILLVMLSMNRDCMASASMDGRQRASASMRRKNVIFTLGFFALALIVAAIPGVAQGITAAWDWLVRTIGKLLDAIVQRMPVGDSGSEEADSQTASGGMGGSPSAFALLMQKIFMVVGTALSVVAVLAVIYLLGRQLVKLIRRIFSKLGSVLNAGSEDYEDEITDTRQNDSNERARSRRKNRKASIAEEPGLSPGERIRRRYLRLLYKHPEWQGGRTARENLPAETAPLYERARYSTHTMTEADAERFQNEIKRL